MKKAILITKDNWESLSNDYGLMGPMRSIYIDRYYLIDNTPWWRKPFGQRRAMLIGEPAFEGAFAHIGRMKVKRPWP